MRIEALLVDSPRLRRAARHLKQLGRLALGDTLSVEIDILLKQGSTWGAVPALVTIMSATLLR
jgi:hypothetical protein